MFEWAEDYNGAPVCIPRVFAIPTATAIELGEIVRVVPGTGIAVVAGTDFDDPACGVAVEAHDGSTKGALGRQTGTEIMVSASPTAIYKLKSANIITCTSGSTATFAVSGLLPQTDDLWNGGMLEIVTCAADPTMVGKRIKITDSTGATGTLTFAAQGAAFAAGDTAKLCPGKLAIGEFGWDLTADGTDIDWDTNGAESLQLVGTDPANMITYWKIRLHQFANGPLAL